MGLGGMARCCAVGATCDGRTLARTRKILKRTQRPFGNWNAWCGGYHCVAGGKVESLCALFCLRGVCPGADGVPPVYPSRRRLRSRNSTLSRRNLQGPSNPEPTRLRHMAVPGQTTLGELRCRGQLFLFSFRGRMDSIRINRGGRRGFRTP